MISVAKLRLLINVFMHFQQKVKKISGIPQPENTCWLHINKKIHHKELTTIRIHEIYQRWPVKMITLQYQLYYNWTKWFTIWSHIFIYIDIHLKSCKCLNYFDLFLYFHVMSSVTFRKFSSLSDIVYLHRQPEFELTELTILVFEWNTSLRPFRIYQ